MVICSSELQDVFIPFLELNVLKCGTSFKRKCLGCATKHMRCSVKESRYDTASCIMCDP